jgi:hypothetical protein
MLCVHDFRFFVDIKDVALPRCTGSLYGLLVASQRILEVSMRGALRVASLAVALLLVTGASSAQESTATIAGIVRDTSGGVLPGATVEATSPELIEKVRTVLTDGTGQFRIIGLRPGTYTVTFSLNGFSTVKREGLEVKVGLVTSVNADMKVGAVEETITVSGETPVVDVQSAKRQQTLSDEVLTSIPTTRASNGLLTLIPSMTVSGGGNANPMQLQPGMIVFGGRGGRGNEGRLQLDGLNTGASLNGGGVSGYTADVQNAAEIAVTTSGGLGEAEVGGPAMNIVPRTGGNSFREYFFSSFSGSGLQGSNFDDALLSSGLRAPGAQNRLWDVSGSVGGPFKRDSIWFFTTLRHRGTYTDVPNMFYNANAGDPTKWTYVADLSRPAVSQSHTPVQPLGRITVQAGQRNKFNLFWDEQISGKNLGAGSSTAAPETASYSQNEFQRVQQATWTMTVTSRLLLEAGIGTYLSDWGGKERPGNDRSLIQVSEQCTAGCATNGGIPGLTYRAQATWLTDWIGAHTWRASASYVTGANSMKFGYQGAYHVDNRLNTTPPNLTYRFNNGVPNRITENLDPFMYKSRVQYHAIYAQDQFTHNRLTLQGAVRFDHSWSFYPEQQVGPTRFLPQGIFFDETQGVLGYNDISPRFGVVYDLFGNGKTAIKFNVGRYLEAAVNDNGAYSRLAPSNRLATSTNRTWTDTNKNFTPDCDLSNPLLNGECGQIDQLTGFGKAVLVNNYDPAVLKGWGIRPGDWQIGATLQQQLAPRISMEVAYVRRWLQNFYITDNLSVGPNDFTQFTVVAPTDSRLPNGGNYPIAGIYDINPTSFGVTNNIVTSAANFGRLNSYYNGLELSVSARIRGGLNLQAGSSTGSQVQDTCEVRSALPELNATNSPITGSLSFSPTNPYCHNAPGVTTRVTALGTYIVPKVDMQIGGTFTSTPGIPLAANFTYTNAQARTFLGRDLGAGAASNLTINLLSPGQVWGDRLNEVDFRVGKNLHFGRTKGQVAVDVLNLFNANSAITYNQTFIPGVVTGSSSWLAPTSVMTARIAKITVQWEF